MFRVHKVCVLLFPLVTSVLVVPAHAGQGSPGRSWGLELSGAYDSIGLEPVAGQGFTKPGTGPEQRLTETPERFGAPHLEVGFDLYGMIFASYEVSFGTVRIPTTTPAGENGELFLVLNDMGFNGRLFSDFSVEEALRKEYDTHRVEVGRDLFTAPGGFLSRLRGYGFFERGQAEYEGDWRLQDFPEVRSETEQKLDWILFGGGIEGLFDLYSFADSGPGIYLRLDGWVAGGSADYSATQRVLNPFFLAQEDEFSVVDERTTVIPGGALEAGVSFFESPTGPVSFDVFVRTDIERVFDVEQANGDQLLQGLSNGIDMNVSPRDFRFGFRLRWR